MKRILHSLVAIAAVATVVLGTAPPASGASAALIEPSAADATHTWVMEQTANDLANASPMDPRLLSAVKSEPVKALAAAGTIPALQREVFGFAFGNASLGDPVYGYPAWSMNLLSTIAYFGLTINWDGNIITSGSGWTTWNSTALTGMVAAAHAKHVRVILSLNLHVFSGSSKSTMCAALHPTHRKITVAATVAQIAKMHIDGVNLDYEGTNTKCAYQVGTTIYGKDLREEMADLAKEMRAALPKAYIAVDTYSGSAADTLGFFDVKAMAPSVNSFFVMTYDMEYYNWAHAPLNCTKFCLGPTSPLTTYYYNDTHVMAQYVNAVGASKTILGIPYYGRKDCVAGVTPTTVPANAYPVSGSVRSDGYLDASQENGYHLNTSYHKARDVHDIAGAVRRDTWHSIDANCTRQMYFDDVAAIGRKYDLVNTDNLRGAGIFALQYGAGAPELWEAIGAHFTHPFAFSAVAATQASTEYTVTAGAYYAGVLSRFDLYSYDLTAGKGWFTEQRNVMATAAGTATWTAPITVHGYPGHRYQYKIRAWSTSGLVSSWSALVTTTVASTATSPLAFKGIYVLRRDGYLRPFSSPPVGTWSLSTVQNLARAAHPLPTTTSPAIGAVLNAYGSLVSYGEPLVLRTSVHWRIDMARDFAFLPNGTGGYVLDRQGKLWPFAVGSNAMPPAVHGNVIWPAQDRARKVVILSGGAGGYVLDYTGAVSPFAIGRAAAVPARPAVTKRWTNDFARDIVLIPGTLSGYVLNGYGGMYPFTAPGETTPARPAGAPYWYLHNVARGFFMLPGSTAAAPGGYILDCAGGLTPWGNAPATGLSGKWTCGQARSVTGA
jgi:GH18 family chitinase